MDKENSVRQVARKEFNWYGSYGVPTTSDKVNVLARVENIQPQLLENSVLRVDVQIRMFFILENQGEQIGGDVTGKKMTKDIEVTNFVQLRRVQDFSSIVSIRHDLRVDRVSERMGQVSVVGTLGLEVTYLGYVVLEGKVTEFPTNSPVRNAAVSVTKPGGEEVLFTTATNQNGEYVFTEIKPGTYHVTVAAEGYEPDAQVAVVMLHDRVNFVIHRL